LIYFALKRLKETPVIPQNVSRTKQPQQGFWLGFWFAAFIGIMIIAGCFTAAAII